MLRIGIIGLGFMGKMHFHCWKAVQEAELVAICDIDPAKFVQPTGAVGNIAGAEQPLDFHGIEFFDDAAEMLAKMKLDAVSITLPTYLHAEYTRMALKAGVNVLCEKPMALNPAECESMVSAARESGKALQVGHCIRFWPEYIKTKELIDSGLYGEVLAATFQRLSLTPVWNWQNWMMDSAKSGGAILDLHIHDSDFVQYLFGIPEAVFSRGIQGPSGGVDHVATSYIYPGGKVITAEGGWVMAPGFGFEMSFNIVLQKATIVYDSTRTPVFRVCPQAGEVFTPAVLPGDAYFIEVRHFADILLGKKVPDILTPEQSADSVRLVLAERKSATSGNIVKI
jgi:1,5-anhydro-D-fructose reductase (1,5-anhydro-D-mannitol-forming)